MAKNYKTGIVITGNAKGGVQAISLTKDQLDELRTTQKKNTSAAKGYAKEMGSMAHKAVAWGAAIAGVASITGKFAETLAVTDKIGKMSDRIGASTEALSEYAHVAELTGTNLDSLSMAWQRQTRRIAEAASGTGEARAALKELGLNADELKRLAPEEQFEQIADAMLGVNDQADKVRLAMKIWDSEGVSMLQTIKDGSAGLKDMRAEASALGKTLKTEQVDQVEAFNDSLARVGGAFDGWMNATTAFAAENLTNFLNQTALIVSTAPIHFQSVVVSMIAQLQKGWATAQLGFMEFVNYLLARWPEAIEEMLKYYSAFINKVGERLSFIPGLQDKLSSFSDNILEFAEGIETFDERMAEARQTYVDRINIIDDAATATIEEQQALIASTKATLNKTTADQKGNEVLQQLIESLKGAGSAQTDLGEKGGESSSAFAKSWEEATIRIDTAFAGAWKGAFDSFSDFADQIKDSFKKLIAEMAHQALTKPILVKLGLSGDKGVDLGGILDVGKSLFSGGAGGSFDLSSIVQNAGSAIAGNPAALAMLAVAAGQVGGNLGQSLGESLFGKTPESDIGKNVGSLFGFVGGTIGGMLDAAFGGDGKKRVNLGVTTSPTASLASKSIHSQAVGASGLRFASQSKRADGGADASKELLTAFLALDSSLTSLAESFDQTVNLSGRGLTGKSSEAGHSDGNFFGSAAYNKVDESQLKAAPGEFVRSWMGAVGGEVSSIFDQLTVGLSDSDIANNIDGIIQSVSLFGGATGEVREFLEGMLPAFQGVSAQGEASVVTLVELTGNLLGVNSVLEAVALQSFSLTEGGMRAAESLSALFGGIDGLAAAGSQYFQAFYSESERFDLLTDQVSSSFAELGLSIPSTREGFRSLVEGLDLTSEAAQQQFASLMGLVPALDQFYGGLEGVTGQVEQLYQDVLGREPDTSGLEYWVDQIVNTGLTIDQVAHAFENSNEAVSNYVNDLYENVLGRAPDAEGFQYWVNEIESGALTFEQVAESFASSQEAIYNALTAGAADFAQALADQNFVESLTERERAERQLNDWYTTQVDTLNGYIDAGYQFADGSDSVLGNIQDIFDRGMAEIEGRFAETVVEVVDEAAEALKLIQADADSFAAGLSNQNYRESLSPQALAEHKLQEWYDSQLDMVTSFVESGAAFAGGTESVLADIQDIFDRGMTAIEERFAETVVEVVDEAAEALKLIQADADGFAAGLADQNFRGGLSARALAEHDLQLWYDGQLALVSEFLEAGAEFADGTESVLGNIQDIFDRGMTEIEERFAEVVVEVVDEAAEALKLLQSDAESFAAGLAERNFREGLSPQLMAEYDLQQWYDTQLAMVNDFVAQGVQFAGGTESVLANIDDIFDRGLSAIEERFAETVVEVVDEAAEALKLIQADADGFAAALADRDFREGLSPRALAEYELQEWYDGQLAMIDGFLDAGAEFVGGTESVLGNIQSIFDRGMSAIEERFAVAVVEVVDEAAEALKLLQADADSFAAGLSDRNFREGLTPQLLAEYELQQWYDAQLAMVNDFVAQGIKFAGGTESVLANIDEIFDRGLLSIEERFAEAVVEVAEAVDESVSILAEAAQQRESLEIQYARLVGDTAELRRREKEQLHESNWALFDRIAALEDAQAAETAAAKAEADRQRLLNAIESEKSGLLSELYRIQGDEVALLAQKRESLHGVNRSLFDHVEAMRAQKEAAEAAAQASRGVIDEILRLRGVSDIASGNPALLQSQFSALAGKAKAGDLDALEALPALSREIEEAFKSTASSMLDVERMNSWLANTMADALKSQNIEVPHFAAGGIHSGGVRIVGEHGPELEFTGPSRIMSNRQSKQLFDNSDVVVELRELRKENEKLRAEQKAANRELRKNSRRTAELMLKFDRYGIKEAQE